MYAHTSSSHGRRGIFAAKHLWVTPHSEDERWPAGMFPLQNPGEYSRGIAEWTQQVFGNTRHTCMLQETVLDLDGTCKLVNQHAGSQHLPWYRAKACSCCGTGMTLCATCLPFW